MKKLVIVFIHLGFWIFICFANVFSYDLWWNQDFILFREPPIPFSEFNFGNYKSTGFELLTRLSFLCLISCGPVFYFSYFFVKPKLIDKKKYLLSALIVFLLIIISTYLISRFSETPTSFITYNLNFIFISACAIGGIVIKYFIDYSKLKVQKEQAENHQIQSELALLKSQLNPHFLFNTLNNIDILISKDAEKASQYLKKLSDILRFMLYETKGESVPLNLELEYIEKFIELQKIRTSNQTYVNLSINGETEDLYIVPMVFIPFIENAFKHTSNKQANEAIKIQFDILNDTINFRCENKKNKNRSLIQTQSGLGTNLIEQRLNLLYKDRHILKIEDSEEKYIVSLAIKLNEN